MAPVTIPIPIRINNNDVDILFSFIYFECMTNVKIKWDNGAFVSKKGREGERESG
jgi:hypothetical protein